MHYDYIDEYERYLKLHQSGAQKEFLLAKFTNDFLPANVSISLLEQAYFGKCYRFPAIADIVKAGIKPDSLRRSKSEEWMMDRTHPLYGDYEFCPAPRHFPMSAIRQLIALLTKDAPDIRLMYVCAGFSCTIGELAACLLVTNSQKFN